MYSLLKKPPNMIARLWTWATGKMALPLTALGRTSGNWKFCHGYCPYMRRGWRFIYVKRLALVGSMDSSSSESQQRCTSPCKLFFFNYYFSNWSIIDTKCCISFRCTTQSFNNFIHYTTLSPDGFYFFSEIALRVVSQEWICREEEFEVCRDTCQESERMNGWGSEVKCPGSIKNPLNLVTLTWLWVFLQPP